MQKTDAFESHAITVIAPLKLQIVVIYYPPGQIIAPFLEELDGLLSSFMEDGTPILVFGDFNIHLDKPYVPSLRRKYPKFSPFQPSYNMSSRPNPLAPSPSNLSHTLTSTHTHQQHISPHRHLPHCVQAGSGNPTAQKTYIKHFSYRKIQTYLSPTIHSQNTWMSCLQTGLIVSFTEQQTGH